MAHMLASHLRSEFLAVPELVRLDMAEGGGGLEPTLLIKANSLSLKYLLRLREFRLIVTRIGSKIAYAVEIPDDPVQRAMVWSLIKLPTEVEALKALVSRPRCVIFLFNELAISMAWTELDVAISPELFDALNSLTLHSSSEERDAELVGSQLDAIRADANFPDTQVLCFRKISWTEIRADYITNQGSSSGLSLFREDEGGQQEEIAVWLTDSLHPQGCMKSPQVHEKVVRELSDILLSYEDGAFLIESKALNILTRDHIPSRGKLKRDLVKHVNKACRQLAGGIKNLRNGLPVTDLSGANLVVGQDQPIQAIILVPDLSLLEMGSECGGGFIRKFKKATGACLHILDPAELLRIVQAAEMIAEDSNRLTVMMAFDRYLAERAKLAVDEPTPYFAVLFRRASPSGNEGA